MAIVIEFTCAHCRQPRYELVTASRICAVCRTTIDKADTEAHIAKLAALPLEERVRKIELALYKLNADSRLRTLELVNVRY